MQKRKRGAPAATRRAGGLVLVLGVLILIETRRCAALREGVRPG